MFKEKVTTIFFIISLIPEFVAPILDTHYVSGAPRLNNPSHWDYYIRCNTEGATLIWAIDGSLVGGFSNENISKTVSSTVRPGFNFSAILLSSQQIREKFYSFDSLLIVSVTNKSSLNISCTNVQETSYVITQATLDTKRRTGDSSVSLEYLQTTSTENADGYNFTSIFVCGVDNEFLSWRTQPNNTFTFFASDSYGEVHSNIQSNDNTVRQLSILIAHQPYQIVTVLFVTNNITDVTIECGYNTTFWLVNSSTTPTTDFPTYFPTSGTMEHPTQDPAAHHRVLIYSLIGVVTFTVIILIALLGMIAFTVNFWKGRSSRTYNPTPSSPQRSSPSSSAMNSKQTSGASIESNADQRSNLLNFKQISGASVESNADQRSNLLNSKQTSGASVESYAQQMSKPSVMSSKLTSNVSITKNSEQRFTSSSTLSSNHTSGSSIEANDEQRLLTTRTSS